MRSPRAIAISRARSLPAARASADETLRLLVRAAAAVVLIGASAVWLWCRGHWGRWKRQA